jgi:hypothetical protein
MSDWDDMSICGMLFQWAKIQLSFMVKYNAAIIIIPTKDSMFSLWYSWTSINLALNNNHSFTDTTIPITRFPVYIFNLYKMFMFIKMNL